MRRYEVVFVLAPTLTEEEVDQYIETFSKAAKDKGAEIANVDKWGKRRLAFRVGKHNEGIYVVMTLHEAGGSAVTELERRFKVTDAVIRFLSVRTDLDLKRAQKFKERRDERRRKRPPKTVQPSPAMEEAMASSPAPEKEEE